jgi:tetratricopeptide (TPR) repeat protein
MAELEEEIIIIEDSAAIEDAHGDENSTQEDESQAQAKKKKIIIFSALGALLLIVIISLTLFLLREDKSQTTSMDIDFIDEKLDKNTSKYIEPSKLENMIAKANYLYANGNQEKALSLYESIAQYSEAISEYNLGVAQLKNKQYKQALDTFSKAISNDEKRCVSAINAAVCSIHLNDKESFKYYIDLAYAYLPYESASPLYSYYYTLISYYNKEYFNALNSLKNTTSKEYPYVQKNLKAKINVLYGNDYVAIEAMENYYEDKDDLSLGLLYARVGDFPLALNHLNDAIIKNIQPVRAQQAIALIHLKQGRLQQASTEIKNVTDMFPKQAYRYYPLHVNLKESLFDTQKAQYLYREKHINSKNSVYQKIFSFSPYKIFNANQTISYIRKGNANIYIDNVVSAQKYLKTGARASNVNAGITKAIKKALQLKIREANRELLELVAIQPKHSILQYNLALTYAQMGSINKANEHFLRSYYLDAKNYLSGIYAIYTSQLINKSSKKLKSILLERLTDEEDSEEKELYLTLLYISENNYISAIEWLEKESKEKPLYLLLDTLIALKLNKIDEAKKATQKLTKLLPREILPHLLYIDAHFYDLSPKKYAASVHNYLKKQNFSFDDLYYGPYITRFLYIQQSLITGQLYFLRQQLKHQLESSTRNTYDIESALALASLYDKQFEESYSLYNHLIDDLKIRDAYTLFLGAVASTAAKHHGNALALLELSKLKNGNFYESRFALALLYMEVQNNEGATIQLSKIKTDTFISTYFDFSIDTAQLLIKKNNQ